MHLSPDHPTSGDIDVVIVVVVVVVMASNSVAIFTYGNVLRW